MEHHLNEKFHSEKSDHAPLPYIIVQYRVLKAKNNQMNSRQYMENVWGTKRYPQNSNANVDKCLCTHNHSLAYCELILCTWAWSTDNLSVDHAQITHCSFNLIICFAIRINKNMDITSLYQFICVVFVYIPYTASTIILFVYRVNPMFWYKHCTKRNYPP